jgi:hypothetical protein
MEGVTTEAWTQAQVDRHANDSLMSIVDAWEATGLTIDPTLPHFPVPVISQHSQPEAQELLSASINDFDFVRSMSGRRSMEQIASCGLNATAVQGVIAGMPVSVPTTSVPE